MESPRIGNPTQSRHPGVQLAASLGNIDGLHLDEQNDARRFKVGGSQPDTAARLFNWKQVQTAAERLDSGKERQLKLNKKYQKKKAPKKKKKDANEAAEDDAGPKKEF